MLIQNKGIRWFMDRTLPSVFVQGLDTLPSFLCYELLIEPTGAKILISENVSLCQDFKPGAHRAQDSMHLVS